MLDNFSNKLSAFTVLYVEDDKGIRENIEEVLKHYFKEVYTAKNSVNAYEKYLKFYPDLIITDIRMEEENGIELIKKIRERDKKTRIIITSAYTNVDYLLVATELHLIKYIVKPLTIEKLEEAFNAFLDSYETSKLFHLKKNYFFDVEKSIIINNDKEIFLTKKEAIFLKLLLSKNALVSYEEIQNTICDENSTMSQNAMRLFIKNLRKKLPEGVLKNVQNVGYYYDKK